MRKTWILLGALAGLAAGCSTWRGMEPLPDSHPANGNAGAAEPTPPPDVLHIEGAWLPPGPVGKGVTELPPDNSSAASPQPHAAAPTPPVAKKPAPTATPSSSADQAAVDTLVVSYLRVEGALAKDSLEGVDSSLAEIRSAAGRIAASKSPELSKLGAAVKEATPERAGGLPKARDRFKALSRSVVALVSVLPPTGAAVPALREIYCPMVKAPWLQAGVAVTNPYYGSAMPTCGTVRKVFREKNAEGGSR